MKKSTSITVVLITAMLCATAMGVTYISRRERILPKNAVDSNREDAQSTESGPLDSSGVRNTSSLQPVISLSGPKDRSYEDIVCQVSLGYDCYIYAELLDHSIIKLFDLSSAAEETSANKDSRSFRWTINGDMLKTLKSVYGVTIDGAGTDVAESSKFEL